MGRVLGFRLGYRRVEGLGGGPRPALCRRRCGRDRPCPSAPFHKSRTRRWPTPAPPRRARSGARCRMTLLTSVLCHTPPFLGTCKSRRSGRRSSFVVVLGNIRCNVHHRKGTPNIGSLQSMWSRKRGSPIASFVSSRHADALVRPTPSEEQRSRTASPRARLPCWALTSGGAPGHCWRQPSCVTAASFCPSRPIRVRIGRFLANLGRNWSILRRNVSKPGQNRDVTWADAAPILAEVGRCGSNVGRN